MENGVAVGEAVAEVGAVEAVLTSMSTNAPAERQAGLAMRRYFTEPGADPYGTIEWERRSAVIYGEKGEVVFEQHDVEIPKP